MSGWSTLTVRNLAFIIQSSAFGAQHLDARVEAFVDASQERLADLDDASFTSQVCMLYLTTPGPAILRMSGCFHFVGVPYAVHETGARSLRERGRPCAACMHSYLPLPVCGLALERS